MLLEDDHVKIWELILEPGEASPFRSTKQSLPAPLRIPTAMSQRARRWKKPGAIPKMLAPCFAQGRTCSADIRPWRLRFKMP